MLENLLEGGNPESAINEVKDAFLRAADNFLLEAHFFEINGCPWLAQRAFADKVWCDSRAMERTTRISRP